MLNQQEKIESIKKYMFKHSLNQQQMADKLGISRQSLYLILKKNREISPSLAVKLENITSRSSQYWLSKEEVKDFNDLIESWKPSGYRTLVDHEIKKAIEHNFIGISSFKEENLEPSSYLLSIGQKILLSHVEGPVQFTDEHPSITIHPGHEAAILTEEYLTIPRNISATLSPTTKVIDTEVNVIKGGIVHPGYRGKIFFIINNTSKRPKKIHVGERIIRIQFTFLPVAPEEIYDGSKQDLKDFPKEVVDSFYVGDEPSDKLEAIADKLEDIIKIIKS